MQTNDFDELVRSVVPRSNPSTGEMGRAAQEISQLRRVTAIQAEATKQNSETVSRSSSNKDDGDSIGRTVLKTAGMATGVGPLVTGLLSLFGGKKEEAAPSPLPMYSMPPSLTVDAGLNAAGGFSEIQYAQNGLARQAAPARQAASKEATTVQINVQAMDSRSFLDHSDDIARAVKEAILHSHSLNDVVTEL